MKRQKYHLELANRKAQFDFELSSWGFIYGIFGLGISIFMVKQMHPGIFWGFMTVAATTIVAYIWGMKASSG